MNVLCTLSLPPVSTETNDVHLEGGCITSNSCLLGITIDSGLKFDKLISDLRGKINQK